MLSLNSGELFRFCCFGKLKMPAGKWIIFTILKIEFDDLLFEKKIVFGYKKIRILVSRLLA